MAVICSNCGAELSDEDIFCGYCGNSIQPNNNTNDAEQQSITSTKKKKKTIRNILIIIGIIMLFNLITYVINMRSFEREIETLDYLIEQEENIVYENPTESEIQHIPEEENSQYEGIVFNNKMTIENFEKEIKIDNTVRSQGEEIVNEYLNSAFSHINYNCTYLGINNSEFLIPEYGYTSFEIYKFDYPTGYFDYYLMPYDDNNSVVEQVYKFLPYDALQENAVLALVCPE